MTFVTRFAPSPTGPLHLGHAYSAMLAQDLARQNDGQFLLRIEDIDRDRSKPEWERQIYDDLDWLGLTWVTPVLRQSDRLETYANTLKSLWDRGFLYPCTCSRRDILDAASAPQEGVQYGPDGLIYPGTCRPPSSQVVPSAEMPDGVALRLNMSKVIAHLRARPTGTALTFHDDIAGTITTTAEQVAANVGDIVLSRKDFLGSYHLSVVLDDAAQNITHVVRGQDLFEATQIHVLLQALLDLPTPHYHHHKLIRDDAGKRLAKRDDARAIAKYRADGLAPADIRALVGLS